MTDQEAISKVNSLALHGRTVVEASAEDGTGIILITLDTGVKMRINVVELIPPRINLPPFPPRNRLDEVLERLDGPGGRETPTPKGLRYVPPFKNPEESSNPELARRLLGVEDAPSIPDARHPEPETESGPVPPEQLTMEEIELLAKKAIK